MGRFILAALLALSTGVLSTLTEYHGKGPSLPDRAPFGFGSETTGGKGGKQYVVTDMLQLREALKMTGPRTVYVKGTIDGSLGQDPVTNKSVKTDCAWYTEKSIPQFNFTRYVMAWNESYMASVQAAIDQPSTSAETTANLMVGDGLSLPEWQTLLKNHIVSLC